MDEENVPVREDVLKPRYPNLDRSKSSERNICIEEEVASGFPLSAERTQSSLDIGHRSADNNLVSATGSCASGRETCAGISVDNCAFAGGKQFAGSSGGQQQTHKACIVRGLCTEASREDTLGDVRSQMQVKTTLNTHFDCTSSSQLTAGLHESAAPHQGNASLSDDLKCNGELQAIQRDTVLHSNQQVNVFTSADGSVVSNMLEGSPEAQVNETSKGSHTQLDDAEQVGGTDIVQDPLQFVEENGLQGGASLEMLSVAVESFEKMQRDSEERVDGSGEKFGVGDLVWAKVKSHPSWPGQIFDAADASAAAKRIQRPGRTLVAFFGDGTFGWLQNSQLEAFRPHFDEKVKQTTMKGFRRAVADALNEVSKRSELGLRCSHFSDALYSRDVFPDRNAGMRKGVRIKHHQDIRMSLGSFEPVKVLEFVQNVARSPCYPLSLGLAHAEFCGHFYGFRNFMLSPKKPKINILPQRVLKVQNTLKPSQSSSLKRRLGLFETGDGLGMLQGKDSKRPHVIKEMMKKEQEAENRLQSPKFRDMVNLFTEVDGTTPTGPEEPKSPDHGKGSRLLAKGNRLQASPNCKEGKRAQGRDSLGPLGDLAHAEAPDGVRSSDDDSKTLLDMTGYRSLKRRKKDGTLKGIVASLSKKIGQQPVEARKELPLKKIGEEKGNLPDSSTSSLITVVSDPCLTELQLSKQLDNEKLDRAMEGMPDLKAPVVEAMENDDRELLDFKIVKKKKQKQGIQDLHVVDSDIEEDKKEAGRLKGADAERQQKDQLEAQELQKDDRELTGMKIGEAEESEKDMGKLAKDSESVMQDKSVYNKSLDGEQQQTKIGHSPFQKHDEGKAELPDLKGGNAEDIEMDEEKTLDVKASEPCLQDADGHDNMKESPREEKQMKRLNSQEEANSPSLVKAKRRKKDIHQQGGKRPRSSLKNECVGSKKPVKGSKLGVSIKKLANTPAMASNLPAKRVVSSETLASAAVEKGSRSPRVNQVRAHKLGADGTANNSFAHHLKSLKAAAQDPSNMKSSLRGVMSAFLKFRSMVFLKSTGYVAAGAGKVSTSLSNGHLAGEKKIDVGRPGKQTLSVERWKFSNNESSEERKFYIKAEPTSDSVRLGSHRTTEQDSMREVKAADMKRIRPSITASENQKSDEQSSSDGTETANGGTSVCPGSMGGASQKLRVGSSEDMETGSGGTPIYSDSRGDTSQKLGVQELAVAARKRKSEVLKQFAADVQAKSVLNEQNSLKDTGDKEKHMDGLLYAKSMKHHVLRAEAVSLPERKGPLYRSADAKSTHALLGIFMQFSDDFILPSEGQLKEMFDPFGALETAGIRVNRNASTAHVVFKHSAHAKAAWQHVRKNQMFGHANVSYRLRHFSASLKSNRKGYEIASAKNGFPAKAADGKAPSMENLGRLQHSESFLSGETEQGAIQAAHSPPRNSHLSTRVEPMDASVSASSPVRSSSITMAHAVCSLPGSMPVCSAEAGGPTVPESSPVISLVQSRVEPEPAVTLVPANAGNCLSSVEQGDADPLAQPLVGHTQEVLRCLSVCPPLKLNPSNPPSGPTGDIQDEMLKLLQQVSFIVSSSTLTPRTT